jgi:membrane fusion protein, multidrug efflux system
MAQPFGRKLKSCLRFFASSCLGGECGVRCFHHEDAKAQRIAKTFVCLLAASVFFLPACSEREAPPPPKPVVPVAVAAAVLKDVPVQLNAIGTVEAFSTVIVKVQVNGELTRVYFKEGQEVRKGELLFTIDPRPFEADLKKAEANLARDLAQSKQAEANLARDTAQAEHARGETRRYERLIQAGVVPREQYEQIRTAMEALEASLRADAAAIESAQEAISADRAAIENAKIQLGYCSIRSPIDGRTGSLMVHEGNIVKSNDTSLVVIHQIHPIYVNFSLPEQNLPEIKKYMSASRLKLQAAMPDNKENAAHGEVTFVDNAVDTSTGTIRLKGTFENKDRRLWPGQFVNVLLRLTTRPNAVVVPSQALQTGQAGPYVFVVRADSTAESRPVVPGLTLEGETVIERGLQPGERVVTDGQLRLVPGARVETKGAQAGNLGTHP